MVNVATNVVENTTTNLNETINQTVISYSQGCAVVDFSKQKLEFINIKGAVFGDILQDSTSEINLTCLQKNSTDSSFREKLKVNLETKVEQLAKSQGVSALLNVSTNVQSNNTTNINKILNSTTISNIQNCIVTKGAEQDITFKNIDSSTFGDVTQAIHSSVALKCTQENQTTQGAILDIANDLKSLSSQSATSGCDSSVFIAFIVGFIVVILALVFFAPTVLSAVNPFKSGGKKVSNNVTYTQMPNYPQYAPQVQK